MKDEVAVASPVKEKKKGKFDDWECREFADTLTRAEEIKADPAKLKAAHEHLKKKHSESKKAISSIDELRKIAGTPKEDMEESDDE